MSWPEIGRRLPRAEAAQAPAAKWTWILGEEGHGSHLQRVFGPLTPEQVWEAITVQALMTPISRIRIGHFGRSCEIRAELSLNDRVAPVIIVWHYDHADAIPRLVTMYPTT